jgi:hypothetical protein
VPGAGWHLERISPAQLLCKSRVLLKFPDVGRGLPCRQLSGPGVEVHMAPSPSFAKFREQSRDGGLSKATISKSAFVSASLSLPP